MLSIPEVDKLILSQLALQATYLWKCDKVLRSAKLLVLNLRFVVVKREVININMYVCKRDIYCNERAGLTRVVAFNCFNLKQTERLSIPIDFYHYVLILPFLQDQILYLFALLLARVCFGLIFSKSACRFVIFSNT